MGQSQTRSTAVAAGVTAHLETGAVSPTRPKLRTSQGLIAGSFMGHQVPSASQSIPQPMRVESQSTDTRYDPVEPIGSVTCHNVLAWACQVHILFDWLDTGARDHSVCFKFSSLSSTFSSLLQLACHANAYTFTLSYS